MQNLQALSLKTLRNILFFILALISFSSCEYDEGEGGTSTIKGVVMVQEYDKDLLVANGDAYPAQDVDIYIIYGDDAVHSDIFHTGWDGAYEFNYLQEGDYTIYTLSKSLDNTETDELVQVIESVIIADKNEIVEVDTMLIID